MSVRSIGRGWLAALVGVLAGVEGAEPPKALLGDTNFFPIAVWAQQPRNAEKYKAAGINTYVALWRGPTQEQIDALSKSGMAMVCAQNETGLQNKENPLILAWMHGDEPDNAQALPEGKGWGPPIPPEIVIADYRKMREADPTRPVFLNLGQGVAWDNWIGRGVRRNHPEDYPEYIKGADIVSFDIYPATHDNPAVAGKLEFVARGVERLKRWGGAEKMVWNCIEASRINNTERKPTAAEIRAEVWMSIIHGSRGIIYFVHQFKPRFVEASLLEDRELLAGVKMINAEIRELAPIIHAPEPLERLEAEVSPKREAIALMQRAVGGTNYLFAVSMGNQPSNLKLRIGQRQARVLGEQRSLAAEEGAVEEQFGPYEVRLLVVSPGGERNR